MEVKKMSKKNTARNESKEQFWYFTFGQGHAHPDGYVKIWGTSGDARAQMNARFGNKWSMQYGSAKHAGVEQFDLYEVR